MLGQVGGAMLGAIVVCAVSWNLLKLVRHPEYGPLLAGLTVVFLLLIGVRTALLGLSAVFILIAAPLLWPDGAEWRNRH